MTDSPPPSPATPPPSSGDSDSSAPAPGAALPRDPLVGDAAHEERVPFRSRSKPAPEGSAPPNDTNDTNDTDADGRPLPRAFAPASLLLFAIVATLGALSWSILDGYQLADSIEYMEHAQALIAGDEVVDSTTIRSKAFAALLTPIFFVADTLGVEDYKPVVSLIRLLLLALGLVLVHFVQRVGARIGGRQLGWVAGLLAGTNPVFLQYTISPVSDLAAGVCVAGAIDALMVPGGARRGLRGGLWLGLGLMIAYKTLIAVGVLGGLVLARDRLKRVRYFLGATAGIAIGVLAQIGLDKWSYGEWGASLKTYLFGNVGSILAPWIAKLGMRDLAYRIYQQGEEALRMEQMVEVAQRGVSEDNIRSLTPSTWYITELPSMLAWPVIALFVLGLLRSARKPRWQTSMLLAVFAVNLVLMSRKGYKDYRLWIPLFASIMPLCALGWWTLVGEGGLASLPRRTLAAIRHPLRSLASDVAKWPRQLIGVGILVAAVTMGMDILLDRNTRKFSGYWDAMDLIAERVETERAHDVPKAPDAPKATVGSAYHWAVYLRESPDVRVVKLPHHLSNWDDYDEGEKAESVAAILEKDWFIVHLPVLTTHPDLMRAVNAAFSVEAMLWDHQDFEDIGPVFVLRRGKPPGARSFYEELEVADPDAYRRERLLPPATHFARPFPGLNRTERVQLLGWEFDELPGDDHGWITYHWYCESELIADYTIVDRLTTFDERNSWHNNHAPCYGVHRTPTWKAGHVYRESWPVVAAAEPYDWRQRYRPMGGAYRRGDLMPASLWIDLATFGAGGVVTGRMQVVRPGESEPVRSGELAGARRTPDGFVFSKDDLVRVGRFFLPVHPDARVPDDGRPIPD